MIKKQLHPQKHFLTPAEKEKITKSLALYLEQREEICFAYLHGSFVGDGPFGDIDIAVYLNTEMEPAQALEYELDLEIAAEKIVKYPVDTRLLNRAPLSFRYSAIKNGKAIVSRNEEKRVDFHARTITRYCDFAPYRRRCLKEAFGFEI